MAWTPTVAALLAQAVYAQERFDEAEALAERSREVAETEDVTSQVLWRRVAAAVLARKGHGQEAERLIREALDVSLQTDSLPLQGRALLGLAEVLALCGRRTESAQALQEAVQV